MTTGRYYAKLWQYAFRRWLHLLIEKGLITATTPTTRVRIRNVNTNTFIDADIQTPHGVVEYEGTARIDGVPGTSAPIALTFLNAAGSKTGHIFPTGQQIDYIDSVPVTCMEYGDAHLS